MNDYKIWISQDNENDILVEMLNEGLDNLFSIEKEFINKGYIVSSCDGIYIKFTKIDAD